MRYAIRSFSASTKVCQNVNRHMTRGKLYSTWHKIGGHTWNTLSDIDIETERILGFNRDDCFWFDGMANKKTKASTSGSTDDWRALSSWADTAISPFCNTCRLMASPLLFSYKKNLLRLFFFAVGGNQFNPEVCDQKTPWGAAFALYRFVIEFVRFPNQSMDSCPHHEH